MPHSAVRDAMSDSAARPRGAVMLEPLSSGSAAPGRTCVAVAELDRGLRAPSCSATPSSRSVGLYGGTPVENPISALGPLGPGDVGLINGSLVAGLQLVAQRLAAGAEA